MSTRAELRERSGWATTAGVLLAASGVISIVHGYNALAHDGYFGSRLVYHNLTFWGWLFIVWGLGEVVAGFMALTGRPGAMITGSALAGIELILWFCMIWAAPGAAIVGVLVNGFILAGLSIAFADPNPH